MALSRPAMASETYVLSQRTEAYTELASSTPLFASSMYFDTLSLGFNVRIAGVTGDKLYLFLRGTMSTSGSLIDTTRFEPFSAEHGRGQYSYEQSGTAGDRILKLQFKDLMFDHDFTEADYMNFQVWLFERDNAIEVHFGPSDVQNPDWSYYFEQGGPAIGMQGAWLRGDPATATADTGIARLSGTPANGTVYRFSLSTTGIAPSHTAAALSIYPVPAGDVLHVRGQEAGAAYEILDAAGKRVAAAKLRDAGIPLNTLPPGQYRLRMLSLAGIAVAVFIMQLRGGRSYDPYGQAGHMLTKARIPVLTGSARTWTCQAFSSGLGKSMALTREVASLCQPKV
jgi:hypothetical protein